MKCPCIVSALLFCLAIELSAQTAALTQAQNDLNQAKKDFVAKVNNLSGLYERHAVAVDRSQRASSTRETFVDQRGYYRGKTEALRLAGDSLLETRAELLNAYDALCRQLETEKGLTKSLGEEIARIETDTKRIAGLIEEAKKRAAAKKSDPLYAVAGPLQVAKAMPMAIFKQRDKLAGLNLLVDPADTRSLLYPGKLPYQVDLKPRPNYALDTTKPWLEQRLLSITKPEPIPQIEQFQIDLFAKLRQRYLDAGKPVDELVTRVSTLAISAEAATKKIEGEYDALEAEVARIKTDATAASARLQEIVGRIETAIAMRPLKEGELANAVSENDKLRSRVASRQAENSAIKTQATAMGLRF